jgi:hypothetical protein
MNRTTTIALLLVFAVLGLYVLLVQRPRQQAEAQATPPASPATQYVFEALPEEIRQVRIVEQATGRSVAFGQDDAGEWVVSEPEAEAADSGAAYMAASQATRLFVSSVLTAPADLSAYGLIEPDYALELSLAGGEHLRAVVGDKTPTGASYYVLKDGHPDVLVVSGFGVDELLRLLDEPPLLATDLPPFPGDDGIEEEDDTPAPAGDALETPVPTATP